MKQRKKYNIAENSLGREKLIMSKKGERKSLIPNKTDNKRKQNII